MGATAGGVGDWAGGVGVETFGAVGRAAVTPIEARRAPTATVESTGTSIVKTVPVAGEGISVSTLSVETSNNASSTFTLSPTFLSQRVTVPSVTDSPSAGIETIVAPALTDVAEETCGAAGAIGFSGSEGFALSAGFVAATG